ncbi:MAG: NAD-dependent epimerase/dehydratase family protein [Flavipsychrobacter sp.]|nr:NAD-dependent epimerase/dehydratase family protein [Flavipsychrobacter sp.]
MINYQDLQAKIKKLEGPIFVFGASGFIGANIINDIFSVREDCYAITHNTHSAWRLKLLDVPFKNILHCDITSSISVKNIFEEYKPKTVFNLAAYGAYSKQSDVRLIYETNVNGTVNILDACAGVSAYIHAGSSSEYGTNSAAPREQDPLEPNSHYAASKVSAAYIIQYYGRFKNVPALNLRLYSVYGFWEEPDRLMPVMIEKARQGTYPNLVEKDISRDFVYITDTVEAFVDAALNVNKEIAGNSYNICTGEKTTLGQLVDLVRSEFRISDVPVWGNMQNRNWDLKDWYGNPGHTTNDLKWTAKTSLKDGLRKTYDWHEEIKYTDTIMPAFKNPKLNAKITAIIACYKDAQAIPVMYDRLVKMFNETKIRYEIIFVNDCSPDDSEAVIAAIAAKDNNVIGITHSRNFGSQSAFLSGMEISTGDAVVLMDGDLQDPPEIIPAFYEKWLEGYDVVYGKRVKREMSFFMNLVYKGFYRIFSSLSYIKIPVDAGDFSMMDRKVVRELIDLPEKEVFLRGLRAWVGFKQTGVDYVRPERMFGVSTNNWRRNIGWAKKAIFSFSFVPLEFLSYLGFTLTGFSFLAIIAQIIAKILYPDVPHGTTTVIVLILFFGGVQLLAISILGEYLSKIFEESKGRPKFIRRSIIFKGKALNTAVEIENFKKDNHMVK